MWPSLYKLAVLVLLSKLSNGELPEDDFRIINKQDLLATDSDIFEDNSSKSFSQLLFDVARDQVIVGARDAIYRLSLRGLRSFEKAEWPAPVDKAKLCQDKGQTEDNCHNYIKILLSSGHKLFACGTNAFSPQCSWREIESVNTVREWVTGVANCPYSPHSNVTALLSSTGEYYTGTPTDFAGSDTGIYRSRGASHASVNMLRTSQYDLNWLNEPQFVGSFEHDQFVYFVFREVAVEFMNCGKIVYSRIARVCKNDPGGQLMMKDKWSTYQKARLNCSLPGDYPFYYDEVQGIQYMDDQKLLIAVFTTPSNSIAGSAVCVYNMSAINAAFEGAYRVQDGPTSTWEPRVPSTQARDHFRCQRDLRPHEAFEYHRYQLMYEAVQPMAGQPLYKTTLERFTHVTADVTLTKHVGRQYVLFVATQDSNILKLSVLPQFKGACLVELWKLKDQRSGYDIHSMQFVKDTMSVYIGSGRGVVRVGALRCGRHVSRAACVGATDPHCAWDESHDRCVHAAPHAAHSAHAHLAQRTDRCPLLDMPVDGAWSSWSSWAPCVQHSGLPRAPDVEGDKPDLCMCRTRECNNPRPANGGLTCTGSNIGVSNCTVHGGWSTWSPWSECSASCGFAVKSRRRSCTAPEPRHGGRVCVGQDSMELYCSSLPPCPDPSLAPVDGAWSSWSAWGACAGGGCGPGAGVRERRRACSSPAPQHHGADCEGARVDRQPCDLRACERAGRAVWTPWVQLSNNSADGSYTKKRFQFSYKASSSEQLKLTLSKEMERYCNARGVCSDVAEECCGAWAAWGECSAPCGGGQQQRSRVCRAPCPHAADMLRPCNTQPCTGEWSCWSEWSTCSGGCDSAGLRTRTRRCLSPEGCADAGAAIEKQLCVNDCDESVRGWSEWGEWSACNNGGRVRRRACVGGACAGRAALSLCPGEIDNELSPMVAYAQTVEVASFGGTGENMSVGGIVGCIIAAYAAGCLSCLAAVSYCARRRGTLLPWRRTTKVPSSPHYITATPNSYVTVPLKDVPRKAKRQPSFTGIVGSSGTLLTKSNNLSNANNHNNTLTTPKLYPKAIANEYDSVGTLKRHSHQSNNKSNIDFEEDKFY